MNKKEDISVLVLPDIHGRKFWKDAVNHYSKEDYPDLDIVFLGDYLDPYESFEGITKKQAYDNFIEILDFAKSDERVKLLIGNHDWHYLYPIDTCRMDINRKNDIKNLFLENEGLFRFVFEKDINGKKYLFSHAGFSKGFVKTLVEDAVYKLEAIEDTEDREFLTKVSSIIKEKDFSVLNKCLDHYDERLYNRIPSRISYYRGGRDYYGSFIWADIHELNESYTDFGDVFQVFGHTISYPHGEQYAYEISEKGKYAMLDASMAFTIDSNGSIKPYSDNAHETL